MGTKLLTLGESVEWSQLLEKFTPRYRDIYLTPAFFKLFEVKNASEARCFVFNHGDEYVMYPFLLNKLDSVEFNLEKTYYDIQPPYGYNGLVATSKTPALLQAFSKEFKNYCNENNIIAELVRFNPVLQNETLMPHINVSNMLDNIGIELDKGYPYIWTTCFEGKVRKAVRKAESHNLDFKHFLCNDLSNEKLEWFKLLYNGTMTRNNAKDYYYFNDEFFNKVRNVLPVNSIIAFVLLNGRPISTQLILFTSEVAYGYLGGTSSDIYYVSPNVYLFHKIIQMLIDMGIKYYSIGGGLSRHDSLYKYKRSFNKVDEPKSIYIGSQVHNEVIYNTVVKQWKDRFPLLVDKYQNYVLKYRYYK